MEILVAWHSRDGHTAALADHIARGIELEHCTARMRQSPDSNGDMPVLSPDDFVGIGGIALGSACYFGGMAGSLKSCLDATCDLWVEQVLRDKPFLVFTSADALHSGLESSLLSMAVPLLHHGMIYLGAPLNSPELGRGAGSIYGANQHPAGNPKMQPNRDEGALAQACGQRLAKVAKALEGQL